MISMPLRMSNVMKRKLKKWVNRTHNGNPISEPFASWQGIVAPVELRMRADDLDATANEQRDEEKVKEVGQSHPQRKSELERVVHNAKTRALQQTTRAILTTNKMPDVDLVNRHPALQSMCSKD